jgi:hypothetical protein
MSVHNSKFSKKKSRTSLEIRDFTILKSSDNELTIFLGI